MAKGSRQAAKVGTAWKARRGCFLLPDNLGYFAPFLFEGWVLIFVSLYLPPAISTSFRFRCAPVGSRMQPLLARSEIATAVSPAGRGWRNTRGSRHRIS